MSEFRIAMLGPGWRHLYDHERSQPEAKGTIGLDRNRVVRAWYTLCGTRLTLATTRTSLDVRDNPIEQCVTCDKCLRAWAAHKLVTSDLGEDPGDLKMKILAWHNDRQAARKQEG